MKITSMRSILVLLAACLLAAGVAADIPGVNVSANESIYYREAGAPACAEHSLPGLQGKSLLGVVELSGHSEVTIDGIKAVPDGSGTFQNHPAYYYIVTPGSHHLVISQPGYTYYIAYLGVCTGKVTYAFYDQEAHLFQGTTRSPVPTTPPVTATTDVTTAPAGGTAEYGALKSALGTSSYADTPGSLSVTTDPAGAIIYIDGIKQGISPATIPGLTPGSHTLLLRLDGYDDLSLPVVISAGRTQYYSSALMKSGSAAAPAPLAPATRKSSAPGSGIIAALCLVYGMFLFRRKNP